MPTSDLSPLAVVPYSKDYLIGVVRHKTGWDQRSEVSEKPQLTYLCNYLEEKKHVNAQTIVIENEYIDRQMLAITYHEEYGQVGTITCNPKMIGA